MANRGNLVPELLGDDIERLLAVDANLSMRSERNTGPREGDPRFD
jgi:hypothetical protein